MLKIIADLFPWFLIKEFAPLIVITSSILLPLLPT